MVPRKPNRFAWYAVLLALGASALYWALVLRVRHVERVPVTTASAPAPGEAHLREATEVAQGRAPGGTPRLLAAYQEWAKDPQALGARKVALDALFAEESVPKKLSLVLAAIEADPTPPEQDPLWPELVHSLSSIWRGDTLTHGLDLMVAEQRPRARRALVSSFAHLATSGRAKELTFKQSQTLTNNFIDMYKQLPTAQQPEVLAAVRETSGPDVADILVGRKSELERTYERALEDTRAASAKMPGARASNQ